MKPEPGMTIGDWIRSMDDMELAHFLEMIISERDAVMSEKLTEQGVPNSLISMPILSVAHHFKFLKSPVGDYFGIEEVE